MSRSKVYVKFPKTGLGNMLLVWGRAYAFASEHKLELFTGQWWAVRWGVWLRNEKNKRVYWGYFKDDQVKKKFRLLVSRLFLTKTIEPKSFEKGWEQDRLFVFKECETERDYFKKLKPWRNEIKKALYNMLSPALQKELISYKPPVIGIHVRRGDFKLGSTITPIHFFVDAINLIRSVSGEDLAVTVFTDATPKEIEPLTSLSNVNVALPKADILDILLLSKSKICILSISSTFSFWGAFLSDGIVLKHPDEWHPEIRPSEINKNHYEGIFKAENMDVKLRDLISGNLQLHY